MAFNLPDGTTQANLDAVDLDGDRCCPWTEYEDGRIWHEPWCVNSEAIGDEPAFFEPEEL